MAQVDAHELGHAVMHSGEAAFRRVDATGTTSISSTTAYESVEHQAKVFASAFLIHDEDATGLNAREISERFCVSLEAAEICFERLIEKAERARSAERVMKINAEVKATLLGNERSRSRYLDEICVICKQQTLVPNGAKVSCETCGFNGDRFQDGDKLA